MTVELDIVERKNEENLKLSKHMSDTMKKLILDENEPIAPITSAIDDADLDTTHAITAPSTEVQRFYAGKNIFITGGTGKNKKTKWLIILSYHSTAIKIALLIGNVISQSRRRMLNRITNEFIRLRVCL